MDKEAMKLLLSELLLKNMGEALDCSRMAVTSDRQFSQLERTLRTKTRTLIADGCKLIDQAGN